MSMLIANIQTKNIIFNTSYGVIRVN